MTTRKFAIRADALVARIGGVLETQWPKTSSSTKRSISRPDVVEECAPGVRRILVNNPSPFTFKGTLSYIVGRGKVAIIDPGPDDRQHIEALLDAVRGETVTHIFVTHTHRDHSPAVPAVKAATGAIDLAEGPHRPARPLHIGEAKRLDASADTEFVPDRALADGEVMRATAGRSRRSPLPAIPQTTWRTRCAGSDVLFAGDHVMGWSTSIVAPPDGAMSDYMASLHRLAGRTEKIYFPGHGDVIRDAPSFVAQYIRHRSAARHRSCIASARARPTSRRWCGRSISGSIPGSPARRASRPSPISRTWWRAASSPPMARRRSSAAIAWRADWWASWVGLLGFSCTGCSVFRVSGDVVDVVQQASTRAALAPKSCNHSATPTGHRRANPARAAGCGSPRRRENP